MIAGIDKKELVFFEFSTPEIDTKLHWEHAKEFEYNNQMYDVVEKKRVNGKTQLWCWLDSQETILNQKLQKLFTAVFSHDTKSKDKECKVFSFYKALYFYVALDWNPFVLFKKEMDFSRIKLVYNSLYYSVIVPPPKN